MFTYSKKDLPKNTTSVDIKIPWSDIVKKKEECFNKLCKQLQIPGFRKGNVPPSIAKKHISKEKVYQEVINTLLPEILSEIIKKENLAVIASPKIELKKAKENEDWQIEIQLALKPEVNLGNFKEEIKKIKIEEQKVDIWIPGKGNKKNDESEQVHNQKLLLKILNKLLEVCKCEISDIIIQEELNNRLSHLLDELQKIGLTIESYLKSKNISAEQLKEQIKKEIEETYKLEFILQKIADQENIIVENIDLEKLFNSISDPKEKEEAKRNAYFYSGILRKQKT
ncbi:MAG: trigger factor, partial [Microgenomates group bacterium]